MTDQLPPPPSTPPQWAPDPHQPGMLRYWDGNQWTHHQAPAPAVAPPTPAPPTADTRRRDRRNLFMWAGLAVIVTIVIGAVAANSEDETEAEDREYAAFTVCKDFVRDQLKSPSSAEFRNYFEDDGEVRVTGSGDGPYRVVSTVDAENSFGASIRSDFVCVVNRVSEDRWQLADLTIDD